MVLITHGRMFTVLRVSFTVLEGEVRDVRENSCVRTVRRVRETVIFMIIWIETVIFMITWIGYTKVTTGSVD